ERMDEVHVPDLADGGLQRRLAGEHAVAAVAPGDPGEAEALAIVRDETLDADLPEVRVGGHRVAGQPAGVQSRTAVQAARASGAVARRSRNARSLNICASSDRSSRCVSVACSGTSSTNTWWTGRPSGASKAIGCARRTNAPRASLRPLMRPWGIATPCPRP